MYSSRKDVPSLKDTCLKFISRNLSRYNAAFCTTDDADLKWNLEYLRRFHSSQIIKTSFGWGDYMDKSYFKFLINEYLEELNICLFKESDWDEIIERTTEVGHAFQKVTDCFSVRLFNGVNFVNRLVHNIPNVKELNFGMCCNDITLEIIASSCPELEKLDINGGCFTKEGLKCLCRRGTEAKGLNLKTLSLWSIEHIEDGISYLLLNMPSLEKIEHYDLPNVIYRMHRDDNNSLQTKYNLRSLDIQCQNLLGNVTDTLSLISNVCPRVKNLFLDGCSTECLESIKRFSGLEDLRITRGKSHPLDCSSFLKSMGGELRNIRLERVQVSADTLIQCCPKVEILHFEEVTFQPLGQASVLTPLYRLRELSFHYLNFNETHTEQSLITVLKSSASLRELSFYSCKFEIHEKILTKLAKKRENSALQSVKFYHCDIDEVSLKPVISTLFDLEKTLVIVLN